NIAASRRPSSPGARAFVGNELVHLLFEDGQRHGTNREDRIVEAADVELRAEFFFGVFPMPSDLQLAKLVGQRLARPCDVAIDFSIDFVLGKRSAVTQI